MKTFVAFVFLAALSLLAEARLEGLEHRDMVMPVNPSYTEKNHPQGDDLRVTDGSIADRTQFPYQVALIVDNAFFCGGVLISEEYVLTAAHCAGAKYEVILGATKLHVVESGSKTVIAVEGTVHEEYDASSLSHDINLIQIPPITITEFIEPVKLPNIEINGTASDYVNETGTLSGWGKTSDTSPTISDLLVYAEVNIISNQECGETFGHTIITDDKLCVETLEGGSPCSGDSGSPLVVYDDVNNSPILIGTVSFGSATGCESGFPAAFTRISSYLDWISEKTNSIVQYYNE